MIIYEKVTVKYLKSGIPNLMSIKYMQKLQGINESPKIISAFCTCVSFKEKFCRDPPKITNNRIKGA